MIEFFLFRHGETDLGRAEGLTRVEIVSQFGEELWLQWTGAHGVLNHL